jgi:hypothetical protein
MIRRASALIASVGAVLMLVPSPACTATANVNDVYMALDANGDRKRNVFFTDTTEIHCVVELGIGRKGVTVETLVRQVQRYDYETNVFLDADRVVAQSEVAPSPVDGIQKVDLSLEKPTTYPDGGTIDDQNDEPFPAGRYICEVRLDGALSGQAVFNVMFPPCPTAEITLTSKCVGVYTAGLSCPRYGASSTERDGCTCTAETGWRCP